VKPLAVIKHFNALKNPLTEPALWFRNFDDKPVPISGCRKTFHGGVVPAISFAAHPANDNVSLQQLWVILAGLLPALILNARVYFFRDFSITDPLVEK
jgi:hypothetical protein